MFVGKSYAFQKDIKMDDLYLFETHTPLSNLSFHYFRVINLWEKPSAKQSYSNKRKDIQKPISHPKWVFLKILKKLTNKHKPGQIVQLHSRIQNAETQMKNGILKRLKFLIDFGNLQKQNLQLAKFDNRLKNVEEKMLNIQTESKVRFLT